jgi:hypothetical protein
MLNLPERTLQQTLTRASPSQSDPQVVTHHRNRHAWAVRLPVESLQRLSVHAVIALAEGHTDEPLGPLHERTLRNTAAGRASVSRMNIAGLQKRPHASTENGTRLDAWTKRCRL